MILGKGDSLLVVDMQNDFLPESDAPEGGRFGVAEGGEAAAVVVNRAVFITLGWRLGVGRV